MKIAVAYRGGNNPTDRKLNTFVEGLQATTKHKIIECFRWSRLPPCDLLITTGYAGSTALREAVEKQIPTLIFEVTCFRGFYTDPKDPLFYRSGDAAIFTFCGIQADGVRPQNVPDEPRPHPTILPWHGDDEGTLILAQKPLDHSLGAVDHIDWILEMMEKYPGAELRHNPVMVPRGYNRPIAEALAEVGRTVSYTSTAAVDSVFAGCETICGHKASEAWPVYNDGMSREEWAHRLSWYNFKHDELVDPTIVRWIMSAYDEAREFAKTGEVLIPRPKVDRQAADARYRELFIKGT